jgi:hypothetical protein
LKLLQERIGKTPEHTGIGNNFLNRILIAQQLRKKIDEWECITLKSFCTAKETVTRLHRQHTE